jgi:hypothetical protein
MIVYGILADIINDHLTMSESQSIKCVKCFAVAIVEAFGLVFLRAPQCSRHDSAVGEECNTWVQGMLESID